MPPPAARLRRRAEFTTVLRTGRRARGGALTVHLCPAQSPATGGPAVPPRVGLVVGRVVGGAVVRNRTRRRLREALARRAPALPAGCALVVRARPESAALSYAALDADLGRALDRALGRVGG